MKSYGTFSDYAALGITRRGTDDGRVINTISMAGYGYRGFAGAATDTSKIPNAPDIPGRKGGQCDKAYYKAEKAAGRAGWSSYCECMFPEGEARNACYDTIRGRACWGAPNNWCVGGPANCNGKGYWCGGEKDPMTCDGKLDMLIYSLGKANPFENNEELFFCARAAGRWAIEGLKALNINVPAEGAAPPPPAEQKKQASVSLDAAAADARGQSDEDLRKQLDVFRGVVPDPNSNPDGAIFYAAYVAEFNFRAQNLCPGLGYRDYRFGIGSDGRPNCGGSRRRAGGPITLIKPPFDQKQLEDLTKRNTPGGGGGAGPNTALIAGGIAVAVAAIFLLKK